MKLRVLLVLLVVTLLKFSATAADSPLCTVADYKIASPTLLLIACKESDASKLNGSGQIFEAGSVVAMPVEVRVTPYEGAVQWLVLSLFYRDVSNQGPVLQTTKKYKLSVALQRINTGGANVEPTTFDIEVTNVATGSAALSSVDRNKFDFVSHVAYKSAPSPDCVIQVKNFSSEVTSILAHDCRAPAAIPGSVDSNTIARVAPTPADIGSFLITLDSGERDIQLVPHSIPRLVDVFGNEVKVDSKAQVGPETAPANKDASSIYINLNYAAGKGSKPGWVLDAKLSPTFGRLYRGFRFSPLASADVGQNQVGDLKYANVINFGAGFSRMFEPDPTLHGLLLSLAGKYETDRQFDRHNLLASPDLRFNFVGLYNTRQRRTLRKFNHELELAEKNKIPWTIANTKPVLFGYALDFHLGAETGGALADTTVKASDKKTSISLPSYSIARLVPQAHFLFEVSRFSVDASVFPRYLTTVENTVVESTDHVLTIKRIHGWQGYSVISGSVNIDPVGHFAVTISYKDGFSPPTFKRVNTVQSGITIKY